MNRGLKIFLKVFIITILSISLLIGSLFAIVFFGLLGDDNFDVDAINLNLTSTIYYTDENGNRVPASISFVPSVMGLIIAGEVIKDISLSDK
jgi:hypothetical protein